MSSIKKVFLSLLVGVYALAFSSCGKSDDDKGPMERAGKEVDQAMEKAREETGRLMERAGEAMKDAGEKMRESGEKTRP
jgi:hypothetical protein